MGCEVPSCPQTYHLPCVLSHPGSYLDAITWTVWCPKHAAAVRQERGPELPEIEAKRAAAHRHAAGGSTEPAGTGPAQEGPASAAAPRAASAGGGAPAERPAQPQQQQQQHDQKRQQQMLLPNGAGGQPKEPTHVEGTSRGGGGGAADTGGAVGGGDASGGSVVKRVILGLTHNSKAQKNQQHPERQAHQPSPLPATPASRDEGQEKAPAPSGSRLPEGPPPFVASRQRPSATAACAAGQRGDAPADPRPRAAGASPTGALPPSLPLLNRNAGPLLPATIPADVAGQAPPQQQQPAALAQQPPPTAAAAHAELPAAAAAQAAAGQLPEEVREVVDDVFAVRPECAAAVEAYLGAEGAASLEDLQFVDQAHMFEILQGSGLTRLLFNKFLGALPPVFLPDTCSLAASWRRAGRLHGTDH